MKMQFLGLTAMVFSAASALDAAETRDQWRGSVGFGAVVIDSGNNLNPEGSQKRLDDLSSAADPETSFIPAILPEVTWDAGEPGGFKFYLTTDPPIDEVGGFALNLGTTYRIANIGIGDTALFFTPFAKVWEDPYATGVDRRETDTTKYGFRVGLNRIMDTGLRSQFVYLNDSVDDDVIGRLIPELERDGAIYSLNLNYSYYYSESLEIRPRMSFRQGTYEGEANSFTKVKADLEMRYQTGKWMVVPRVYYSHSDYEEIHPVFGVTRKNDGYGASLMATYLEPFNQKNWSATSLVSISRGDSNIDFFDTKATTVGAMLSYHF